MHLKSKIVYLLCVVVLMIVVSYLTVAVKERGYSEITFEEKTNTRKNDAMYVHHSVSNGRTKDVTIPTDREMDKLTDLELTRIYWRYVNTLQVLCRNQTRMGLFTDGGKEVCVDEDFKPNTPCLVYSFGSRFQFDFEESVNFAFGCEIHTFDPTKNITKKNRKKIPSYVTFHLEGLAGQDCVTKDNWQMKTLETIMKDCKHTNMQIDLLKIDIEGWEYDALDQAITAGTLRLVKQLLVEFHFRKFEYAKHANDKLAVLRKLYDEGFRLFMRDRNPVRIYPMYTEFTSHYTPLVELSFINMFYRG